MNNRSSKAFEISAGSIVSLVLILFNALPFLSSIGVGLFVYFTIKLFNSIGNAIEIRDIMIVIALLQWILGPVLTYTYFPDDEFYNMTVTQDVYMQFALWASVAFIAGLYVPFWKSTLNSKQIIDNAKGVIMRYPFIDLLLIIGGVVAALAEKVAPGGLKFFLVLLGGMRFIGLYFLIIGNRANKWIWFTAVIGWLIASSLSQGMFHDLILWMGFLIIIFALLVKFSNTKKILYFGLMGLGVILIQTIKHEFRKEVVGVQSLGGKTELFLSLSSNKLSTPSVMFSKTYLDANVNRINQGWIVARIMNWTPQFEPYAGGETILAGIEASLLPRFLAPNKAVAGGRTYFKRFTGREINSNTSMGLSPLGEAYANFGVTGGYWFMFGLGFFYNFYLFNIFRLTKNNPTLILWLPLLFLQVVKAETDFAVVLNHLVKASLVVWMIFFGFKKVLGIKI